MPRPLPLDQCPRPVLSPSLLHLVVSGTSQRERPQEPPLPALTSSSSSSSRGLAAPSCRSQGLARVWVWHVHSGPQPLSPPAGPVVHLGRHLSPVPPLADPGLGHGSTISTRYLLGTLSGCRDHMANKTGKVLSSWGLHSVQRNRPCLQLAACGGGAHHGGPGGARVWGVFAPTRHST